MPDEGEATHVEQMEQQSTAGKWILLFLAIVFVAATVYGHVTTRQHVDRITTDLRARQAQLEELKKRKQSGEAQEETSGEKLGMTKKELGQRAAELQGQQK